MYPLSSLSDERGCALFRTLGRRTVRTRGQTRFSMTQLRMRPTISCSTFGMSCSFAREPIKEVEASSRMKSGWSDADRDACIPAAAGVCSPEGVAGAAGGISKVSCDQNTVSYGCKWTRCLYEDKLTVALNRTSARAKLTGMMANFGLGKLTSTLVSMPRETWSE